MKISDDGKTITMRAPDNWHAHFRQLMLLLFLVPLFIKHGWRRRVVAEPNLTPPNLDGFQAIGHCQEIIEVARQQPLGQFFEPVPTIQITEQTTKQTVIEAFKRWGVKIVKAYPFGLTHNSENGIKEYEKIYPILQICEELDIVTQFHGQHPSYAVEGKDKEKRFIDKILQPIDERFPNLRKTLEHVQGKYGIDWVKSRSDKVGGGLTVQHMTDTIDDVIGYSERSKGKFCVHNAYKPHAGDLKDMLANQDAAVSGDEHFFYGGDDAWHLKKFKECAYGACGAANTLAAIPVIVAIFKKHRRIEMIEKFLSVNGANYYGYPLNEETITVQEEEWTIDKEIPVPGTDDSVVPWFFGEKVQHRVLEQDH